MHSEEESYRGTMAARTVDGERHTLIITRRNTSNRARVWLTLHGAWKTTVQLTDPEAGQLVELLTQARALVSDCASYDSHNHSRPLS